MRIPLTATALLAVFLLVACGPATGGGATPPTIQQIQITTDDAPSDACMEALITGGLVAHEQWGLALQVPGTGELIRPLFPFGYSAAVDGNRIALLDEEGNLVAHTGDLIQSSGGFIGAEGGPNVAVLCAGTIRVVPS